MSAGRTERRAFAELRGAEGRKLLGYAAVFNSPAQIGRFSETIRPGAFKGSLAVGSDIRALVDHDPSRLLGRTASGTLRLGEDAKGLSFELDVPETTLGNDVLTMVQRGDISGMSFGFRVPAGGDAWPSPAARELRAVMLDEISILHVVPAYGATSVEARAAIGDALARRRFLEMMR